MDAIDSPHMPAKVVITRKRLTTIVTAVLGFGTRLTPPSSSFLGRHRRLAGHVDVASTVGRRVLILLSLRR